MLSTQNRTKAKSQPPVTSHPLFPAIVALWFGALFGLGSLAVRASLIESLIIASHLDVLVPMAAPPLGMTARILIALFMAMIGVGAGAAIARRITRPRPVARNRVRTASSVSRSEARKAEFVREVQSQLSDQQIAADKADAVRRRALASHEASHISPHHDEVPLPGGAPQILDVTQFDLAAPGSFEADLVKEAAAETPLDLTGFAAPQAAPDQSVYDLTAHELTGQDQVAEPAAIAQPASIAESYGDDTDSFRAKFANEKKPLEWTPEPPPGYAETADEVAAPIAELAQGFDPAPAEAAYQPQFESQPASFASEPARFAAPTPADDFLATIPQVPAAAAAPELPRINGLASAPAAFAEGAEADGEAFLPQGSAAERIASADLAELSPVELIERFALALKQRRHTGAFPAALLETAAAFDLPLRPQPSQVPQVLAEFAAIAQPQAEAEPAAEPESALELAPELPAEFSPEAASPFADEIVAPPAPQAAEAAASAAPLFAAALHGESDNGAGQVAATRPPLSLPAAMRPIEFGEHGDHDDLADQVPPRSFAMPRLDGLAPAPAAPAAAPFAPEPVQQAAESEGEADVNEAGYSSLLALSKTAPLRQTFVRIDEPASELAEIEPVVIFPGQATRPGTRFSRPAEGDSAAPEQAAERTDFAPAPLAEAPGLRRFDAPPGAVPSGSANAGGAQDPAEAERALRSALANLQRMSGAA